MNLAKSHRLVLSSVLMFGYFCNVFHMLLLYPLNEAVLPLVHSQSSG